MHPDAKAYEKINVFDMSTEIDDLLVMRRYQLQQEAERRQLEAAEKHRASIVRDELVADSVTHQL